MPWPFGPTIFAGVSTPVTVAGESGQAGGVGTGAAYLKFEHPASGYAVVGAAAIVGVKNGRCESARLCFNGVTATPLDVPGVGAALAGKALDDAAIDGAVNGNLKADDPLADVFASGEYRVHLAKVFGRRALKLARDRAS